MKMKRAVFLFVFILAVCIVNGQKPSIELTYTAIDNEVHVQFDSIRVINRTHSGDTVLYYPDTVLVLDYILGMAENVNPSEGFIITQAFPNPSSGHATISVSIPDRDRLEISVSDISGKILVQSKREVEKGLHTFSFTPGYSGVFICTARWRQESGSVKVINEQGGSRNKTGLEYLGPKVNNLKEVKNSKAVKGFQYDLGDKLKFVGYAGGSESGLHDAPTSSQIYEFQFATNIPCPGMETVSYGGQVYNTIQVFSQCWIKENLNIGTMVTIEVEMSDNGIIEKYCYNDEPDSCAKYGGLYQWEEIMQYVLDPGVQGICPEGWHVPTKEDWKILDGAADSQYSIGDTIWDETGWRGFDAGYNLKSVESWPQNANGSDAFGFQALPDGYRTWDGSAYDGIGFYGYSWSSERYNDIAIWAHSLNYLTNEAILHRLFHIQDGYSVRCIKDL